MTVPLLYRILMRLAAVVAILGALAGIGMAIGVGFGDAEWPLAIVLCLVPAGALYALAWIVRPPLDRASLRRLWRE